MTQVTLRQITESDANTARSFIKTCTNLGVLKEALAHEEGKNKPRTSITSRLQSRIKQLVEAPELPPSSILESIMGSEKGTIPAMPDWVVRPIAVQIAVNGETAELLDRITKAGWEMGDGADGEVLIFRGECQELAVETVTVAVTEENPLGRAFIKALALKDHALLVAVLETLKQRLPREGVITLADDMLREIEASPIVKERPRKSRS